MTAWFFSAIKSPAASATWLASPTSGNWEASASENNWSTGIGTWPGGGSTSSGDAATFNSASTFTTITIGGSAWNVRNVTFDTANCAAYTITSTEGNYAARWTGGGGITINSTVTQPQTFSGNAFRLHSGKGLFLTNNSTTLTATINFTAGIKANNSTSADPFDQAVNLQGSNTGSNVFSGVIADYGTPANGQYAAVTKSNAGTWYLTGNNSYTGPTRVAGGLLVLTGAGAINNSTNVTVSGGTLQCNNPIGWTNAFVSGGSLVLNSSANVDNLSLGPGTLTLTPGLTAQTVVGALTLSGGTTTINIISNSTWDTSGVIPAYPTALHLIQFTSLAGSTNTSPLTVGPLPQLNGVQLQGYIATNNGYIDLVITGGPTPPHAIVWNGRNADAGNALTSVWDNNTTRDWLSNATAVVYNNNGGLGGDIVIFNDNGATNLVALAATVSPTAITVSNNARNYTINDNNTGYALAGSGGLTKQGPGTLVLNNAGGVSMSGGVIISGGTLQVGNANGNGGLGTGPVVNNAALVFSRNDSALNISNAISGSGSVADNDGAGILILSGANSFTGPLTVASGGVLQAGNNSALGSTDGGTTISSGATLDVNSRNLGQEPVTVSGVGYDGNGAIVNNLGSPTTYSNANLARVTMAGDTTFGGSSRLDLRSPVTGDALQASLTMLGGGAFNLTKKGANQMAIVGMTVDPNLANVDIQGGILSVEAATTGLGNPSANLTVENGATLGFYNMTNQLNKNIILNGNGINGGYGTVNNLAGNNTVIGPITFNGNVEITFLAANGSAVGGSLTLSNVLSGTGTLSKENTNTLIIAGTDNRNAATTINLGTFILNGIHANNNVLYTVDATSVLGGNGTNAGTVYADGPLHPGAGGKPSTFGAGELHVGYNNNPPAIFDLSSNTTAGSGINDMLNVTGDLEANYNVVYIHPLTPLNTNGTYTLARSGSRSVDFGSVQIDPAYGASRYQFSLDQGSGTQVLLKVSGGPVTMFWDNNFGDGLWNPQGGSPVSANWSNGVSHATSDSFYSLDSVVFDDSNPNPTTSTTAMVTIASNVVVLPSVILNNSTTINYSLVGTGKVSGTTGFIKSGGSTLTITTSNDFTGDFSILGGTVVVANNGSLGATNGTVTITNGGTLDVSGNITNNGLNFGVKPFVVSGSGVGGNGAIINNNGTNQDNAFQNVTLAGDTTFGGSARWDIRSPVNTNAGAVLSSGGHGYKLTKTGTNFIALSSVAVDPALGDIDVQAGTLSIETQTVPLGNPANKLTVFNGATLEFWNLTNVLNKPVVLQSGSTLINGSGNNTYAGPVTVQGDATLNVGGLGLTLSSPMGGAGNLTKTGTSPLTLTANNTNNGAVLLNAGTTYLTGSGSLSASTNISVVAGAILDVSGRGDFKITLNNGQALSGSGQVVGLVQESPGSAISPGDKGIIGTLTVSSTTALQGNTYMEVTNNGALFDVLHVGTVIYGGTLTVSNLDATHPFTTNNSWQLFNAGTYGGVFTNFVPANPNGDPGLAWDTNSLTLNGTLKVKAVVSGPPPTPRITAIGLSGTILNLSATNGASGGQYFLLSSTNVSLPVSQWQTNVTGNFDGAGHLNLSTNIINQNDVRRFYILKQ